MTQSINCNLNAQHMKNHHSGYAVRPVKSTMQMISVINGIVGVILLGVSAILFFISFQLGNYPGAVLGLRFAGGGIALGGIVESIVSAVFRRIASREQEKLEFLKTTGTSYSAEITRITSRYAVMVGRRQSVYAECTYTNNEGKICLVKSKSFMYDAGFMTFFPHIYADAPHNANYIAKVYVNPHIPHDYAVEVFTAVGTAQVDYDNR